MSNIIHQGSISTSQYIEEDGKGYVKTTFNDKHALDKNARLRSMDAFNRSKLDLHDGEDVRMSISCPSAEQWALFRKQHSQSYALLTSKDEAERMRGATQLQLLHPAWVIYSRL